MAKFYAPFLPLCFLLLSSCLAQSEQNECLQLNRLEALQPDNRIRSEAGTIETWNPNNKQFRCAGVAFTRCTIQPNGLRMPSYSNAPQLIYIQRGNGVFGMVFPGCAETFHETEQQSQQGRSRRFRDRHQKIQRFREGDMIAVPTGIAFWMYNNGENPVVAVSLLHTDSYQNQLDLLPRRFYLAGNQEQEFIRYQQQQQQQQIKRRGGQQQQEEGGNNMYSGFDEEFLEEIFNIDRETATQLKGSGERRKGDIVKVREGLRFLNPPTGPRRQQEQEQEEQQQQGRQPSREEEEQDKQQGQEEEEEEEKEHEQRRSRESRRQSDNGLEETVCTMKLRHNIGRRTYPDIFVRDAGAMCTLNSLDLPVLQWLRLSAEHGTLRRNAMLVPHYNLNSNSVVYALSGSARVQVVNCSGDSVYDRELEAGQLLMVPQNFPAALRAESETFEYVSFKTNDRAMMAPLAGRTSLLKLLPEEVLVQSYRLRAEQARQLKNNNRNVYLAPPNTQTRSD